MTKKTVSMRLDPEVWKEAKIYAVKKGLKFGDLVETALREKLRK